MTRPFTLPPDRGPTKPTDPPPPTMPRGTEKFVQEAEKRLNPNQRARLARVEQLIRDDAYILTGLP